MYNIYVSANEEMLSFYRCGTVEALTMLAGISIAVDLQIN